ncbi:hypothetical protein [Lewinella sp. W8]|uniref:hypothetical protein n=1 Tax=Lewinella sp. W8 TaxID=2528208 RepID=UPI001068C20A|nr:hypothetical protein [Lewinella sp. W8]MTB53665.1 hypothetical protein [Lewinella sp. W8]
MRLLLFSLSVILLAFGCQRSTDGTRLLEVTYPPIDFVIPAGQPNFQTLVIAQDGLATRFVEEMMANNVDPSDIDLVGGLRGRVTSLDGQDLGELERIELRACPIGQPNGCNQFDILFSVDDLFRRRDQVVNLNPGLRNFRNLFVGNDNIRIEIVLTPGLTTSITVEARLEWSVTAIGDLD